MANLQSSNKGGIRVCKTTFLVVMHTSVKLLRQTSFCNLTCCPSNFLMASLSSDVLIAPSPLVSNFMREKTNDHIHNPEHELLDRQAIELLFSVITLSSLSLAIQFLTSLKASLSSFTPIISAVSARSLGPINSTKSSKST